MPIFHYQYKRINFGKVFNPLVLLPVKTTWGWQKLWFLVDSGADTVMLPISLAKKLGFTFDSSVKTKLHGIGKQSIFASPGKITLKVNGRKVGARSYFVYSNDSLLLLGRLDFFDKFSITFDRKKQSIIFTS